MIAWDDIETVILDMDGTLLDLNFDRHVWHKAVPEAVARKQGQTAREIAETFSATLAEAEGTLAWYCLDHWSHKFDLDVSAVEHDHAHLIDMRPGVETFLDRLVAAGYEPILATNAHQRSMQLKFSTTGIDRYFNDIVCAHDVGEPKESLSFWQHLQERTGFDPGRTVLIDDNEQVLETARDFGIAWLFSIAAPNSRTAREQQSAFPMIDDFADVLPRRSGG